MMSKLNSNFNINNDIRLVSIIMIIPDYTIIKISNQSNQNKYTIIVLYLILKIKRNTIDYKILWIAHCCRKYAVVVKRQTPSQSFSDGNISFTNLTPITVRLRIKITQRLHIKSFSPEFNYLNFTAVK